MLLGLGGTLRLGFNPGELLDFILGWTAIDIYNDDAVSVRKQREEESIGIGSPIAEAPSLTTGRTDRVSGGSAVSEQ
jgi:hypothetical protein